MGLYGMDENYTIPDDYYEALGDLPFKKRLTCIDTYRFQRVLKYLTKGSVLDVGAYYGDFLRSAQDYGYNIIGTEINKKRVDKANVALGKDVVRMDFRHGKLETFRENEVDNVVCMEVLEHIEDYKKGLQELCRVAKKRVIITVPYKQEVRTQPCVHCCQYTPLSGHLHGSFDLESFDDILPEGWYILKKGTLGNIISVLLANSISNFPIIYFVEKLFSKLFPDNNIWMYIVFEC